jgi:hypothetical protein
MASRKKRFFYIILTAHFFSFEGNYVRRLGYGVTDGPGGRVRKYSNTSGGEQEFCMLWYSDTYTAEVLEDILKERVASDTHKINGETVEWIKPSSMINVDSLTELVEGVIKEFRLDLRLVKSEYLPFTDSEWQKEINAETINTNPEKYLDKSVVDKKRKNV